MGSVYSFGKKGRIRRRAFLSIRDIAESKRAYSGRSEPGASGCGGASGADARVSVAVGGFEAGTMLPVADVMPIETGRDRLILKG